ncbi:MAG: hypothetical protein CSA40_00660 [Flavobacteriales bacterium]|nr:MAG: hypothetical protein CSA40_00660 [Flavobacteriales bacterium]
MWKLIFTGVLMLCLIPMQAQEEVLFIGNSMTYFNDMPMLFQDIAQSKGMDVQVEQYAPGGTGFVNHVNDDNVYDLFASREWDAVILQPGTGESAGVSYPTAVTAARGQRLIDSIRVYSPCAKIILYEISNGIAPDGNGGGDYDQYFATQTKIKDSITRISNALQIPFAPAGECFRAHYEDHQDLLLHGSYNDVHPNLNGSYLVACSVFNTLYQDQISPSNAFGGLEETTATYLQNISDDIVLTNKPDWLINVYNLFADFSYTPNGLQIHLQNMSVNYDTIQWDINGELTTDEPSPVYTFPSEGLKTIALTAMRNGCSVTMTKQIEVSTLGMQEVSEFLIEVFPNPASEYLYINACDNPELSYTILDMSGRIIMPQQAITDRKIKVSALPQGFYMLVIEQEYQVRRLKFFKAD